MSNKVENEACITWRKGSKRPPLADLNEFIQELGWENHKVYKAKGTGKRAKPKPAGGAPSKPSGFGAKMKEASRIYQESKKSGGGITWAEAQKKAFGKANATIKQEDLSKPAPKPRDKRKADELEEEQYIHGNGNAFKPRPKQTYSQHVQEQARFKKSITKTPEAQEAWERRQAELDGVPYKKRRVGPKKAKTAIQHFAKQRKKNRPAHPTEIESSMYVPWGNLGDKKKQLDLAEQPPKLRARAATNRSLRLKKIGYAHNFAKGLTPSGRKIPKRGFDTEKAQRRHDKLKRKYPEDFAIKQPPLKYKGGYDPANPSRRRR